MKSSPLKRGAPLKRGGPVNPKSRRRVTEEQIYLERREVFLDEHRLCEIRWDRDCAGWSSEVHHRISRGVRADLYLDEENWVAACSPCHRRATAKIGESYARGTSGRSTDAPNSSKIVPRPETL